MHLQWPLYTDIVIGKSQGTTSVPVLFGETKIADVERADADARPDYVYTDPGVGRKDKKIRNGAVAPKCNSS